MSQLVTSFLTYRSTVHRRHSLRALQIIRPAAPLIRPILNSFKISTLPVVLPTSNTTKFKIHRLQVRICSTYQRLPQVIEAMSQVVWIRPFVVVVLVLHLGQCTVQSCVVADTEDVLYAKQMLKRIIELVCREYESGRMDERIKIEVYWYSLSMKRRTLKQDLPRSVIRGILQVQRAPVRLMDASQTQRPLQSQVSCTSHSSSRYSAGLRGNMAFQAASLSGPDRVYVIL